MPGGVTTDELPRGWAWATVDEVIELCQYGSSAKTNEDPNGVPVLRMGNLQNGSLDLTELKYLPREHDEFPSLLLRSGDLLFNRTNSFELVGKSAVYSGVPSPCSYASYLVALRFGAACEPKYLCFYLNSHYGRVWVKSVVSQQVGQADQLAKFAAANKTPPKNWQAKYPEPAAPDSAGLPELPPGWCWAGVEQLGDVQLGRQRSPKNRSDKYPTKYVRAANITEAGLSLGDLLDMEFEPHELETYRLAVGDLLLSEASGSPDQVGKPAMWAGEVDNCCFQNTVIRHRAAKELTVYLLTVYRHFYVNKTFAKVAAGVGINHLSAAKFSRITVPLPPLAEQEQIVAAVGRGGDGASGGGGPGAGGAAASGDPEAGVRGEAGAARPRRRAGVGAAGAAPRRPRRRRPAREGPQAQERRACPGRPMSQFSDYIVYVDESGDHSLSTINKEFPLFVLTFCVFKKSEYVEQVVPTFQRLKFDTFGHDMIVMHEHDIREAKWPFEFLTDKGRRNAFMSALSEVITNASFQIIAVVLHKEALAQASPKPDNIYHLALGLALEPLWSLLSANGQTEAKTHVVFEARGKKEDHELKDEFHRLTAAVDGTRPRLPLRIVIADKKTNSTGLQLADLTARPIGRHVLNPTQKNRAYDVIAGKLAVSAETGKVEGFGLICYPPDGSL